MSILITGFVGVWPCCVCWTIKSVGFRELCFIIVLLVDRFFKVSNNEYGKLSNLNGVGNPVRGVSKYF